MKRKRLQWIPRLANGPIISLEAGPPPTWPGDPILSARDELIFLLHTASEVEHALLAQYLYAAWSVPSNIPSGASNDKTWQASLMYVAKQEMGHLITVQNILRSLRAPLSLDRDDYPFRSELYPFEFALERVTLSSLAKYVLAEMPKTPAFPAGVTLAEIQLAANQAGALTVNPVGLLYERLINLVDTKMSNADFSPATVPMQAKADRWRAHSSNGLIVQTVASKADALGALKAIAEQGEGSNNTVPGGPPSHFDIFVRLFIERRDQANDPVRRVASNPNTSPPPTTAGPDDDAAGRILNRRSRLWALLGNLRYRILLTCIRHSLSLPDDVNGPEQTVREEAFREMMLTGQIGVLLAQLPQGDASVATRAGLPLEMPYSLDFPDSAEGIWLLHRDLIRAAGELVTSIRGLNQEDKPLLDRIEAGDAVFLEKVNKNLGATDPPITTILQLRLLPALAIARFGSSPSPLDNYELGAPDAKGWHPLAPAETLVLNNASGEITEKKVPATVQFRDGAGLIRPVCPFIEVWAQFTADGPLQPLTVQHLEQLGLTVAAIKWRVSAGNHKAARRTGVADDQITADTGEFSDHAIKPLRGNCPNFKSGKTIPLGQVRFVKPNAAFPQLRLRFTPATGKVYGPDAGDPNIADDVYDATRGRWKGFPVGLTNIPPSTEPGGIYAQSNNRGLGYVDDSCDALIKVNLALPGNGAQLSATARVTAGPPQFSPDTLPVRTVADELQQWLAGPALDGQLTPAQAEELGRQAAEIIRRALGTMRLLNTPAMNRGGMAAHDTGWGRARDPIFSTTLAQYATVEQIHEGVLSSLQSLADPPGSAGRQAAVQALNTMVGMLRRFDQVGDLTDAGRRKMPAMMRGADALHLALTRRQVATVEKAAQQLSQTPAPTTPEGRMLALIEVLRPAASVRHGGVPAGAGNLNQLFADPPALLNYLRTEKIKNDGGLPGETLVVPGRPNDSAFVKLIERPGHPMQSRFSAVQPTLGNRTGAQIVREWITSLL